MNRGRPTYTFFRLDRDDLIVERFEKDCGNDAAALEAAETLAGETGIEVWIGPRKVGQVKY